MKKFFFFGALSVALLVSYAFAAEPAQFDFGDAPDPAYSSRIASNGARHKDISRVWLGDAVDVEADARVRDLDNGDDGLVSESPVTVRVTAAPLRQAQGKPLPAVARAWYQRIFDVLLGRGRNRPYYINVLVDRDNSGSWQSSFEWVVQNQRIVVPAGSSLEVRLKGTAGNDVLWDRASEGWMRVTLTDARVRNYDGTTRKPFQVGETEDYAPVIEPTDEPQRTIWCFVDEKACRTLTKEESNEARDNKMELKGPYPDNVACMKDCGERTIETPTPRRKFPPENPAEKSVEGPVEKTVPTESPFVPARQAATTCFLAGVPADFYPDGPDVADPQILTLRCTADSPSGVVNGVMTVLRRRLSDRPVNQYPVVDNRIQGTTSGGFAACGGVLWSGEAIGNASVCITAP